MQSVARRASISFICFMMAAGVTAQNPAADILIDHDFLVRPIELSAQPLPFVDWSMVEAGHIAWVGPDGQPAPLNDPHDIERAK